MKILLMYKSGRPGAGDYFARMMPVGLGWINALLCGWLWILARFACFRTS